VVQTSYVAVMMALRLHSLAGEGQESFILFCLCLSITLLVSEVCDDSIAIKSAKFLKKSFVSFDRDCLQLCMCIELSLHNWVWSLQIWGIYSPYVGISIGQFIQSAVFENAIRSRWNLAWDRAACVHSCMQISPWLVKIPSNSTISSNFCVFFCTTGVTWCSNQCETSHGRADHAIFLLYQWRPGVCLQNRKKIINFLEYIFSGIKRCIWNF